jgi:hypothetical protein
MGDNPRGTNAGWKQLINVKIQGSCMILKNYMADLLGSKVSQK